MRWWVPPLLALQFLTRVPVRTASLSAEEVQAGLVRAAGWFPLIGALVGLATSGVAMGAALLWPIYVAVPIALAVEARLTGAFHEDAVADFCDAFGGGHSRDDVRRIMKDSRIGSYGAVGLVLALGLRAALTIAILYALPPWEAVFAIVAAAGFGRLVAVMMMAVVAPAIAGQGLAKDVATGIGPATVTLALVTGAVVLAPFTVLAPWRMLAAVTAAAAFLWWFRGLLLRRIGGSTGDCLGFAAYAGQVLLLLAAAAR